LLLWLVLFCCCWYLGTVGDFVVLLWLLLWLLLLLLVLLRRGALLLRYQAQALVQMGPVFFQRREFYFSLSVCLGDDWYFA
jgi:hypothetical protein